MELLYNRKFKWYDWFDSCNKELKPVVLTNHARRQLELRNGKVAPELISEGVIVEVLADKFTQSISKFVVRNTLDEHNDIIFAIANEQDVWVVKTCWINSKDFHHEELSSKGYVIG